MSKILDRQLSRITPRTAASCEQFPHSDAPTAPYRAEVDTKEKDIGITEFLAASGTRQLNRPTCLYRWSLDDVHVEDVWAPSLSPADIKGSSSGAEFDVTSVGFDDKDLARQVRDWWVSVNGSSNPREKVVLSSCADFGACTTRRVWCSSSAPPRNTSQPVWLRQSASGGVTTVSSADPATLTGGPRPPALRRFTILLRCCDLRASSAATILDRVNEVAKRGVVNYTTNVRHGFHLSRSFGAAQLLMQRKYREFLCGHLTELTEGISGVEKEVRTMCDLIMAPTRDDTRSWMYVQQGLVFQHRRLVSAAGHGTTGLYLPHVADLLRFAERMAAMRQTARQDGARVLREALPTRTLTDALRAATDVHFNCAASLRLKLLGREVQVGDVVVVPLAGGDEDGLPMDSFVTREDHHFSLGDDALYAHNPADVRRSRCAVKVIESTAEAKQHHLSDLVLPLLCSNVRGTATATPPTPLFATHRCGRAMFHELALGLHVAPLPEMQLAPPFAYRPLVVIPRNVRAVLVDDVNSIVSGSDELLKERTRFDSEGYRRLRNATVGPDSRLAAARCGFKGERRQPFVKLVSRPGPCCVLQFDLPVGSSPMSVVREIFLPRTVDPSALLRHCLSVR